MDERALDFTARQQLIEMADTFITDKRTFCGSSSRAGRMRSSGYQVGYFSARLSAERATQSTRFHSGNHGSSATYLSCECSSAASWQVAPPTPGGRLLRLLNHILWPGWQINIDRVRRRARFERGSGRYVSQGFVMSIHGSG